MPGWIVPMTNSAPVQRPTVRQYTFNAVKKPTQNIHMDLLYVLLLSAPMIITAQYKKQVSLVLSLKFVQI